MTSIAISIYSLRYGYGAGGYRMDTIVETSREYYKSSTSSSGGDTLHPGQEQVRLLNFDLLSLTFMSHVSIIMNLNILFSNVD